jgi:hypothetical protein
MPADSPELTGSEKQIRWAQSIRKQKSAEWSGGVGINPNHQELLKKILRTESAAWWISYRDSDLKGVLNQTRYGVDKVKEELEEYRKSGQTGSGKNSAAISVPRTPSAPLIRLNSDEKFMLIGPTRDRFTGEVVTDERCPF